MPAALTICDLQDTGPPVLSLPRRRLSRQRCGSRAPRRRSGPPWSGVEEVVAVVVVRQSVAASRSPPPGGSAELSMFGARIEQWL